MVERLLDQSFTVCPIRGSYSRSENDVKCIGDEAMFLVFGGNNTDPILMVYGTEADNLSSADHNPEADSAYLQLVQLCVDKFNNSKNPFEFEFKTDNGSLIVHKSQGDNILYTLRTSQGVLSYVDTFVPRSIFSGCTGIVGFKYTVVTDSAEKEVLVRKGQIEIMREIAHYVNKTLVFYTWNDTGILREYAIAANGCCEMIKADGKRVLRKVQPTKIKLAQEASVFALDTSMDSIMKYPTLSSAIAGGSL